MTNTAVIFIAERCPGGEITMQKPFINHIFINLGGRDFKGPKYWFVSPRGASRDAGTDVSPYKTTSASVQCRFGTSSVSSLQPTGKLLGPKTVLLEQVYTAYSQLVTIAGLWHGLKQTSNQRRFSDFTSVLSIWGSNFGFLRDGARTGAPRGVQSFRRLIQLPFMPRFFK